MASRDFFFAVGISESTVYEHFKSKEDILFSVPLARTRELIRINEDHLRGLMGAWVKLRKLVWNYFEFLIAHDSYMNLPLFELRGNRQFYRTEVYGEFKVSALLFKAVILDAMESGEIRPEIDSRVLLNLVFGVTELILRSLLLTPFPRCPIAPLRFEPMPRTGKWSGQTFRKES